MAKKIVYIVGGLYGKNGMSQVLSQKMNYLARNTDYHIYMVLTERPKAEWVFEIDKSIEFVNFDINFDELDTMPILHKFISYRKKQKVYKKMLSDYLCRIHPDITVSAMRREINFINDIKDGSIKIGEIHFNKSVYRVFSKPFLPHFVNKLITQLWRYQLIRVH